MSIHQFRISIYSISICAVHQSIPYNLSIFRISLYFAYFYLCISNILSISIIFYLSIYSLHLSTHLSIYLFYTSIYLFFYSVRRSIYSCKSNYWRRIVPIVLVTPNPSPWQIFLGMSKKMFHQNRTYFLIFC